MSTYLAVSAAPWGARRSLRFSEIRAMRSHGTAAVSVGYQQVLLVGFLLWLAYGVAIANVPLMVTNSVAAVASAATILVALRCRRAPI